MPECGMLVDCPGLSATEEEHKKLSQRLMVVDLIRELTRNLIGLIAIPGILIMLYKFVEMSPPDDRMNIMLLVIGYLGGLATGITTWYFGGAMRSAVQTALDQAKGSKPNTVGTSLPQQISYTPVAGNDERNLRQSANAYSSRPENLDDLTQSNETPCCGEVQRNPVG